jgi:hypothetical protein
MAHNQPEGEVQIMSHISRVSLVYCNYPTTQPLAWPFLIALAELRWLEETATHWSGKWGSRFSVVAMATGNKTTQAVKWLI